MFQKLDAPSGSVGLVAVAVVEYSTLYCVAGVVDVDVAGRRQGRGASGSTLASTVPVKHDADWTSLSCGGRRHGENGQWVHSIV